MKKRKTVKTILVSFVMLLCLVGAGWTQAASGTKGFTDFTHIEAEYLESLEKLDWPEGMTLPETLEGEEKRKVPPFRWATETQELPFSGNIHG